MGVYIKGMKMPDECFECIVNDSCGAYRNYTGWKPIDRRLDDCPLVEVPVPHGRLIDADVCRQKVYDGSRTPYKACPTVIEAEGE